LNIEQGVTNFPIILRANFGRTWKLVVPCSTLDIPILPDSFFFEKILCKSLIFNKLAIQINVLGFCRSILKKNNTFTNLFSQKNKTTV